MVWILSVNVFLKMNNITNGSTCCMKTATRPNPKISPEYKYFTVFIQIIEGYGGYIQNKL